MTRSSRKITRRKASKPEKKLFIISSEGGKTEPRYFMEFKSDNIRIKFVDRIGTVPISVLNAAKEYKEKNLSELKNDDEIWIVVDTDFSPDTRTLQESDLTEVGDHCVKYRFGYAVSNPCFEYWFLLHFEKNLTFSKTIREQDKCISLLKNHYPYYKKSIFDPNKFTDKSVFSIENA